MMKFIVCCVLCRLNNLYRAEQLPVMVDECPLGWNVTSQSVEDTEPANSWWLHLSIYEISYMWYSGLSCCLVLILGSGISLLPSFRQEEQPDGDLLVPVLEVLFCCCPAPAQSVLARLYKIDQHKHNAGHNKEQQTQL